METQSISRPFSASARGAERRGRETPAPVPATADPALAQAAALLTEAGYTIIPPAEAAGRPRLSAREQQVAGLLVEGASNKIIARELDISVHTAKFHVTAVLDKVGARNRADAVAIILREGLIAL